MAVLEKAAKSPSDAAILSVMKNLVENFIMQWLSAPQVEVGEKGSKVLGDLLDVDCELPPPTETSVHGMEIALRKAPGQGMMWRRILHDREIYGLILSLCTAGPHQKGDGGLDDHQLTLAQGRLLRVLPRLAALNLAAVARTDFPDLNQRFTGANDDGGLLFFAALRMVDKEDMLMHLNLIDFFETLLSVQRVTPYSVHKSETLRKLFRTAAEGDIGLRNAIFTLHERTVPEEAGQLKQCIADIVAP